MLSNRATGTLANHSQVIELSADEGHDADIPSNIGAVGSERNSPHKVKDADHGDVPTELEKDIENGSHFSGAASVHVSDIAPESTEAQDPNIVFWDGPTDPENPMNWSQSKKWGAIAVVSSVTLLTPLGSSIIAPGVPGVMDEFNSTSEILSAFIVSVYVLGFAFGPLVIAPLSEMYGRMPLYHTCSAVFVIMNMACALSKSLGMLIAFRFLAGCVGAAPITLGGGSIADMISREQRGTAMALWILGPTLGPVIGPVCGGFISAYLSWRWNFWILTIASGVGFVGGLLLLRETYAPAILERKTRRLRKQTGNLDLRSKLDSGLNTKDLFKYSIVRPSKMLLFSPIVQAMSTFVAIEYAYLYIMFTTFTQVFEQQYGFGKNIVGLAFIGMGIGQITGQVTYTIFGNRTVNKHLARGDFKPEHRLPIMIPGAAILPIALFWYAWTVEYKVFWVVPMIATGFFGFGLLMTFMPANTYLVDVFTVHAASAMAANTVLRSVLAAFLPLAGPTMFRKIGLGWGNTILGFVALAMVPVPFIFVRYGERIRTRYPIKL